MTVYLETRINRYIGASGDSKPDTALVGSTFYEYDTGEWFVWVGASWESYEYPLLEPTSEKKLMLAQGLLAETLPRRMALSTLALTSQSVYYVMAELEAGMVITNLHVGVSAAATSMTLGKLGIYDADGELVASTGAITTAWEGTGLMTHALSEPYEVPETGVYYFAVLAVASSGPTLHRGTSGNVLTTGGIGSSPFPWGSQGSEADLPSTATIGAGGGSAAFWIGAS
jgi:hypothetical protein